MDYQIMPMSRKDTNDMDRLYSDVRAFKIRTQEELRRARRYAAFVSLISMDFSHINGDEDIENSVGLDKFMKSLHQLIRSSIRDTDIINLTGGKKLLLLLIDTPMQGADALVDRLQKAVRYFMCNNVKSPYNWRVPIKRYCFPESPGEEINLQSIIE